MGGAGEHGGRSAAAGWRSSLRPGAIHIKHLSLCEIRTVRVGRILQRDHAYTHTPSCTIRTVLYIQACIPGGGCVYTDTSPCTSTHCVRMRHLTGRGVICRWRTRCSGSTRKVSEANAESDDMYICIIHILTQTFTPVENRASLQGRVLFAGDAVEWLPYSISYWHNRLLNQVGPLPVGYTLYVQATLLPVR